MSTTVSLNDNWKMKKAGSRRALIAKFHALYIRPCLTIKRYQTHIIVRTSISQHRYVMMITILKLHSPQTRPQWSASILSCTLTALIP